MTPAYAQAKIVHDTHRIIEADDAACLLFGQEREWLIDQPLSEGIHTAEMKWLARLRFDTIKEKGEMPPQELPFVRLNGSVFWARCKTTKREDGLFETTITYLYEY